MLTLLRSVVINLLSEILRKEKKITLVLLSHLRLQKLWPECVVSAQLSWKRH